LIRNLPHARLSATVVISSALLCLAAPADAQNLPEPRTWTVAPFLGASFDVSDPAPGNSIGLGVAVSYDWTSKLAFEGEVSHLFDVAGDTPNVDWSISNFSANALYRFDTKYVTPYATFGLGVERSSSDSDPDDPAFDFSDTEFAINFGVGMTHEINDRWRARGDLRRFQSSDTAPDYWRLYAGLTFKIR
jgi:hypothetical protein